MFSIVLFLRRDTKGKLPIHAAASRGLLNVVQLLLKDNSICIDCIDNIRQTPLLLAAKNGSSQVVTYLLSKQADYTLKDCHNLSAFDWAVNNQLTEVIEVFLSKDYWKKVKHFKKDLIQKINKNRNKITYKYRKKTVILNGISYRSTVFC